VFVNILESAKENWSVGHGIAQFARVARNRQIAAPAFSHAAPGNIYSA
jgi:hypothetical protein